MYAAVHNPLAPRLRYVADRYSPGVVYLVARSWAEAVGADDVNMELEMLVVEEPGDGRDYLLPEDRASAYMVEYMEKIFPGRATRFDRYLPWLARSFNQIWKPVLRKLRRDLREVQPGQWEDLAEAGYFNEVGGGLGPHRLRPGLHYDPTLAESYEAGGLYEQTRGEQPMPGPWTAKTVPQTLLGVYRWHPESISSPLHRLPLAPWRRKYREARADSLDLLQRFRSIATWAEKTGVDLNQYDAHQARHASAKWVETYEPSDVEQGDVVYTFPDGWTVQHLTTASQLEAEGEAMQHCVGDYELGDSEIYSLRTPGGSPHATMEWAPYLEVAVQLKGKQNAAPKPEYLARMVTFRREYLDPNIEPALGAEVPPGSFPAWVWELPAPPIGAWWDYHYQPAGAAMRRRRPSDRIWVVLSDGAVRTWGQMEDYFKAVTAESELLKREVEEDPMETDTVDVTAEVLARIGRTSGREIPGWDRRTADQLLAMDDDPTAYTRAWRGGSNMRALGTPQGIESWVGWEAWVRTGGAGAVAGRDEMVRFLGDAGVRLRDGAPVVAVRPNPGPHTLAVRERMLRW